MKVYHKNKLISNISRKSYLRGLMFSKKLKKNESIILDALKESKSGTIVHMFFVFFSIDAVWLDSKLRIVDIKRNIKPFTPFVMPKKKARYVLEMSKNGSKDLKIGEKIEIR